MNKSLYILALFLTTISCKAQQQDSKSNNTDKPNIVFILADDCTHWDIGAYGSKDAITPNIDKLANEGVKFNRCYQAAPMCSPTRHNIYTGLYPVKSGAYPNHAFAKEGTKSVVHYLEPLGYRVALSGKRHINPKESFPFEYLDEEKNINFNNVEKFLGEVKSSKEPFALMLCSNEPHGPWNKGDASKYNPNKITLPPHYVDNIETRKAYCSYLAEINYLDDQVGKTMDLLKKYNFDDNTLVVFASEQGNSFPFAKWTTYEAGVKSALIAHMPSKIKGGKESDAIVEYTDLVPTFIEMAGGEPIATLDGKSLVPIFKNPKKDNKDYAYSLQTTRGIIAGADYYAIRSVVGKDYRYIWNITPEAEFLNVVNNADTNGKKWFRSWEEAAKTDKRAEELLYKYKKRPKEELYHVKNDKWCIANLAEDPKYAEVKNELRTELLAWMEACGDEGQATEMDALNHKSSTLKKGKGKKNKGDKKSKKKGKKGKKKKSE
ncbi:sulfatase [uncultured Algibacter sp.]|uniref:sulfatase family protein n=1 Tax=uncultured Algibacter sp. TaxID=298659 RepID=UPI00260A220C|nr:sulfatase [uncultured Algibacter sp.]